MMRAVFLFVFFITSVYSQEMSVTVRNPAPFSRAGETVEINLHELYRYLPAAKGKRLEVLESSAKKALCSQQIDYDGNGVFDLMIFQSDFAAESEKFFLLRVTASPAVCDTLTDGRFVLPREDFAWENDMIAFRIYGPALAKDVRNGVDVWTKRVPYRIVAKWYKESEGAQPGKDSYHIDKGEGADFFSVGKTLGAGGSAMMMNDSMVQPPVFSRWRKVADGPLRVCFELLYDSLKAGGKVFTERRRISLDAGSRLNKVEVSYKFDVPDKEKPGFVAGIVKRKNVAQFTDPKNRFISLWGLTNDDSTNGYLGTAALIPEQYFVKLGEDNIHVLAYGKTLYANSCVYYSGAAWSRHGGIKTEKEWIDYLRRYAERVALPLKILFTGSKEKK